MKGKKPSAKSKAKLQDKKINFLVGVNNGWFFDRYANDLGHNQYSDRRLWHWPYTDDISHIDFGKPDPNPPRPLLSERPELIDSYFQSISGLDIVRIWLFERLEGICFDENKQVIGIDNEFLTNLNRILDTAYSYNVKTYLCFFDSWVVRYEPPSILPESRLSSFQVWNATITHIMKSIVEYPIDFINNVVNPMVERIRTHPSVYAIDIMNEPEGMTEFSNVVSNSSMCNYISACSTAIRPRINTSIGCMRVQTAKAYSSLPINFCDIHLYNETAAVETYTSNNYNQKRCIVGECGYPISSENLDIRSENEVDVAKNFVRNSLNQGYSACLVWNHDFTSEKNNGILIEWLKEFARTQK